MASDLELALYTYIRMAGLPEPETEVKLIPDRRFRYDMVWPRHKLAVEIQGGIWQKGGHSTGAGISRDTEKLNLATLQGYRVLQVTGDQIKTGQALLWIKKALQMSEVPVE